VNFEEQRLKGEKAKQLLNDPLLHEALQETRKEIIQMWEATPARDAEAREWLWKLHQASMKFENALRGYIDSGQVATEHLKHEKSFTDRLRGIYG
jgi:transposase